MLRELSQIRVLIADDHSLFAEALQAILSTDQRFEATRKLSKKVPKTCVLMLTGSNARHDVNRARAAGAAGYVTKDRIAGDLIEAILQVVEHEE